MGKIHDRFKKEQIGRHFAGVITNGGGQKALTQLAMVDMGLTEKEVLHSVKVKGHYDGLCNVTHCQSPNNVHYYNRYTHAFYCPHCTGEINRCNAQFKDADEGKPFINFKTKEEAAKLYVRNK